MYFFGRRLFCRKDWMTGTTALVWVKGALGMEKRAAVLQNMRKALEHMDIEALRCYTREVASLHMDPLVAIRYGLLEGIGCLSEAFDEGEIFIPQLLVAAEAVQESVRLLSAQISAIDRKNIPQGRVLVYVVEGDIHDIGKTIVATVLSASGFEVVDLGRNVPAARAAAEAAAQQVDVIINFALMTTTKPVQAELIRCLQEQGIRDGVCVLLGGTLCSREWVREIGADAYAESLTAAVQLTGRLIRGKKKAQLLKRTI